MFHSYFSTLSIFFKLLDQHYFEDLCDVSLSISEGGGDIESGRGYLDINYSPNLDCSVTLTTSVGRRVLITWEYFDVQEKSDGTCKDTLIIHDGLSASGTILNNKTCGRYLSKSLDSRYPSIVSSGNSITVRLVTDSKAIKNKDEFKLVYTSFTTAGKLVRVKNRQW